MSIITRSALSLATTLLVAAQAVAADNQSATTYGFGSVATTEELSRFISPLPDGTGLPPGSGSVEQGKVVYQSQCLACHGDKLQGGLGDKLIGGRGTLANADPGKAPVKTIESYWPYATTLFDYVKRAMPLMAPGSLSNDEVYAVSAYILSEAKIIPGDTVLGPGNLANVRMPNRDGFVADHRPDKFKPVAQTGRTR